MQKKVEYPVFVYGSLRRGQSHHHLLRDATFVGVAATRAAFRLVDLGGYPGIVEGGTTAVVGEIFLVSKSRRDRLDAYEDHPHLFERRAVTLGGGTAAEFYVFVAPLPPGTQEIPHGDWARRASR